jgi:hypothetical protein
MFARPEVLGGVPVGRVIATTDRAAFLAHPEMNPIGANLDAFIALRIVRAFDGCDRTNVQTSCVWHFNLSYSCSA